MMPFAVVNGIQLFYESYGDGPAVVFVHGRGGNHLSWWQQVPAFAARYRCVLPDQRGFGRSLDAADGPGRSAYVDDLCALLDILSIERTYLVAQSLGGWTCLNFTLKHPQRVRGLVLADTTAGISDPRLFAALQARGSAPGTMLERVLSEKFRRENATRTFLYSQISTLNTQALPPSITTATDGPDARTLTGLRTPTLFIAGAEDPVTPPNVVELAASMIPGASFELIPEAGHSAHFEMPERFNAAVLGFFDRIESTRGACS